MPTTFYVARHGQSGGNVNGDIMGADPPLTAEGARQAKTLAKVLASVAIDQVFTSNLLRAKQTAQIIADQKKLPVSESTQIRERFFGKLEGQKGDDVWNGYKKQIERFNQISLIEQLRWRIVKDMESLEEVLGRVLPFLDKIATTHRQKTILLVTHANVMLSLLAHFSFVNSLNELPYGSIQNTAYIKIEKGKESFQITEVFGINKNQPFFLRY